MDFNFNLYNLVVNMFRIHTNNLKKDERDNSLCLPVSINYERSLIKYFDVEETNKGGISFSNGCLFRYRSDNFLSKSEEDFKIVFNKCDIRVREGIMKSINFEIRHPKKGLLGENDSYCFCITTHGIQKMLGEYNLHFKELVENRIGKGLIFLHKEKEFTVTILRIDIDSSIKVIDRINYSMVTEFIRKRIGFNTRLRDVFSIKQNAYGFSTVSFRTHELEISNIN